MSSEKYKRCKYQIRYDVHLCQIDKLIAYVQYANQHCRGITSNFQSINRSLISSEIILSELVPTTTKCTESHTLCCGSMRQMMTSAVLDTAIDMVFVLRSKLNTSNVKRFPVSFCQTIWIHFESKDFQNKIPNILVQIMQLVIEGGKCHVLQMSLRQGLHSYFQLVFKWTKSMKASNHFSGDIFL